METTDNKIVITFDVEVDGEKDHVTVEVYGFRQTRTAVMALIECGSDDTVGKVTEDLVKRGLATKDEIDSMFKTGAQ